MIDLSDKPPPAPKPKSKATKSKEADSNKGQKVVIELDEGSKPPAPRPKKRAKDYEVKIQEMPIPKPKKKARRIAPSEQEDNAKDILRSVKKAATVKRMPIPKDTEVFFMGEDTSPRARNIKRLAEGGAKVPVIKRRKRIRNVA